MLFFSTFMFHVKRRGREKKLKRAYFVAKRDKISKRIDRFLAQFEEGRASTITFIEFIHEQFLNFGCKNKAKGSIKGT